MKQSPRSTASQAAHQACSAPGKESVLGFQAKGSDQLGGALWSDFVVVDAGNTDDHDRLRDHQRDKIDDRQRRQGNDRRIEADLTMVCQASCQRYSGKACPRAATISGSVAATANNILPRFLPSLATIETIDRVPGPGFVQHSK